MPFDLLPALLLIAAIAVIVVVIRRRLRFRPGLGRVHRGLRGVLDRRFHLLGLTLVSRVPRVLQQPVFQLLREARHVRPALLHEQLA